MASRTNLPALPDPEVELLSQRERELLHEIDEHRSALRAQLDELNRRAQEGRKTLHHAAILALWLGGSLLAVGLVWRGVVRMRRR